MPSARFISACLAQETAEQPILLMTIDHAEWDEPLRLATGGADVVSNGETFVARAMEVLPPGEGGEAAARSAKLVLDNVEQDAVALLRSVQTGRPTVVMEAVLADFPDDIEESWSGLSIIASRPTGATIECDISTRDDGEEEFPVQSFSPRSVPGLF